MLSTQAHECPFRLIPQDPTTVQLPSQGASQFQITYYDQEITALYITELEKETIPTFNVMHRPAIHTNPQ